MLPLLFLFLVVLLTRLYYFYHEVPLTFRAALVKSGIEVGAVALIAARQEDFASALVEHHLLLMIILFPVFNAWAWFQFRDGPYREGTLVLQFLLLALSFIIIASRWPTEAIDSVTLPGIYLLGGIICLNEVNLIFRWLIRCLQLKGEDSEESPVDRAEYNRGRVIGMLERLLIFVMAVIGEYTAIGFVLALKAAIRFPELKNRAFAEYVLVGTLLSTIMAVGVALLAQAIVDLSGIVTAGIP